MALEDRQQLSEIVEAADIAVRAASQLRLYKAERPLKDRLSLERAIEFLDAAISGGTFIVDTGQTAGLRSTLRPLNWAVDVRFSGTGSSGDESPPVDYSEIVEFLRQVEEVLKAVIDASPPDPEMLDAAVDFFSSLGNLLGTRADQQMRMTSGVFGGLSLMALE